MTRPLSWPPLEGIEGLEVTELDLRASHEALVEHFGLVEPSTQPMDLIPTEEDEFRERLRRAGLLPDINLNDPWEGSR